MDFTVYIIRSKSTNKIYLGQSSELATRLKQHNGELPNRKSSFTSKNKGPWILVYKVEFKTRSEALRREKELKSHKGRDWIRKQIWWH